jgi:tRNA(fMet)-specific endonuclease VapC
VKQVSGYERLHRLIERYQELRLVDFDEAAANHFVSLRAAYRRSNTMDLKIAAIAMSHDALLVSRNARDFLGIGELRFEPFAG